MHNVFPFDRKLGSRRAEIFVKNGGEIYFLTAGSDLRLSSLAIKSEPLEYTCGGRSLIRREGGKQER